MRSAGPDRACFLPTLSGSATAVSRGTAEYGERDYGSWKKTHLSTNDWNYPVPTTDLVHFEFGTGASTFAKSNLIAFQRLYKNHNPIRKISDDGIYGPATASALNSAPCHEW